eukprot:TRINITY_DN297_c0_g2_i1.p1 TRINITY_DN297_c0_g2~~TRINITY_DN297_c0_g2_i1.p1  ORF type:complete len:194 (+),score=37.72 TRINITY_DN297_c0_g2_i1:76-657(+)
MVNKKQLCLPCEKIKSYDIPGKIGLRDRKFRCEGYGPLGALEGFIKAVASIVAIASITQIDYDDNDYPGYLIAQLVFVGILGVLRLFLIGHSFCEKEIRNILFQHFVFGGILLLFYSMLFSEYEDIGPFIFTWTFLMILGEYVRLMFLFIVEDYQVIWLKKPLLFLISIFLLILYSIVLIIQSLYYFIDIGLG